LLSVYSMTGYARVEGPALGGSVSVEIKSVNHRYLELRFFLPPSLQFLEADMARLFREKVCRGRVEVRINLSGVDLPVAVEWNRGLAKQMDLALKEMKEELGLQGELDLAMLAGQKDVLTINEKVQAEEESWKELRPVLEDSLSSFLEMRAKEGAALAEDLMARLESIGKWTGEVERNKDNVVETYRQRLQRRLSEILEDPEKVDRSRLEQEVALLADRADITEELVRTRSHLDQMGKLIETEGAKGRKLDFLTQELFREITTMGNKAQDAEVSRLVVDMKAELEKIREQVQNLE